MDVTIQVAEGNADDVISLTEWLATESELRGAVHPVRRPIGDTEMGPMTDALSIAVGSGGAASVLASALITWFKTRRTTAKLVVRTADRSVELEIRSVDDVQPLLRRVLDLTDDD